MFNFIEGVFKYIGSVIEIFGYWGIGIGMLLESMCIPIPSELVLPIGGFLVANGRITMFGANLAVTIGSMIGSVIAYLVGYYGGRPFILKYGKFFFLSEKHFYQADSAFNKYGSAAVFFGRLLPVIRTFISLPAGIARMDFKKFTIFSLIGMIPWNAALIYLGFKFRDKYSQVVRPWFKEFEYAIIVIILLIVIALIYKTLKKKQTTIKKVA